MSSWRSRRSRRLRQSRIQVRTRRRDQIDYDALARAVLEQAAMADQVRSQEDAPAEPVADAPGPKGKGAGR